MATIHGRPNGALLSARGKVAWTLGNFLMLVGVYLLLYVGGLLADERYNIWAAQGDSPLQIPGNVVVPATLAPATEPSTAPLVRSIPPVHDQDAEGTPRFHLQLNSPGNGRELNTLVPTDQAAWGANTVSRIQIPVLHLDKKVQEVGWRVENQNGTPVAIWDVAKYTVGHHQNTANPGQPGNIVLAGHSGGDAYPFNDLFYLKPKDTVVLWSNGKSFNYSVQERLVLDELGPGVTDEQRRANATYIGTTPTETLTMVTCWPLTGPLKFTQRVVIRAVPNGAVDASGTPNHN